MSMKALCIDGSHMIHRAKFVASKNFGDSITWPSIAFLFMNSLIKNLREFPSDVAFVLWDVDVPEHRIKLNKSYKASRTNEDEPNQAEKARSLAKWFLHVNLPTIGVPSIAVEGAEADDLAYLVAQRYEAGTHITDDLDWTLNLPSPEWVLFRPIANKVVDLSDLLDEEVRSFEEARLYFLYSKAMIGDNSDEIEGIPSIGEVTANKFSKILIKKEYEPGILGQSARAKAFYSYYDRFRRNVKIMDTSWITSQTQFSTCLEDALDVVNREVTLTNWLLFTRPLDSEKLDGRWDEWRNLKP